MPILEIKALPQESPKKVQLALKKTALAIAEAYGCEAQHVWITWEEIKPGFYLEGDSAALAQPLETHPPIARLTCFEGKSSEQIEKVLIAASKTLAGELELKDNMFISYHEAKSGQVIAGNGIVRKK